MRPDRAVALFFLAFSIAYAVLAWDYPLLPFEKRTPFRPNTLPIGLAVVAIILSTAALIAPGGESGLSDEGRGWRSFDWRAAGIMVLLMVLYAASIRAVGYIPSTSLFLISGAVALGERRFYALIPVALSTAAVTWLLVQGVLGVFLSPWPVWLQ